MKHVIKSSEFFREFQKFNSPCWIKAAGNETLNAIGHGKIEIKSTRQGKIQQIILKDVCYVPKVSRNLFSVLAAQDRNSNSRFESSAAKCRLKVYGKTVLSGAREVGGTLYKAAIEPIIPSIKEGVDVADSNSSMLQLYHERWGHQDKRYVQEMLRKELNFRVNLDSEICEPCVYRKTHHLPFGTREKATKPGKLISTDFCGPFDLSL